MKEVLGVSQKIGSIIEAVIMLVLFNVYQYPCNNNTA